MSENSSGCLFTLGISLHKGIGGGADRTYLSQRRLSVGVPANAPAHRVLN